MASILPTSNFNISYNNEYNGSSSSSSSSSSRRDNYRSRKYAPTFLHRLIRYPQMDFEFALWQMGYLLIAPRRVYRNIYYHKQTKNQWSRDDPAFIVLLITFLTLSGIVWSTTYHFNLYGSIKTILSMVFFEFLFIGCIISTATWYITNKFLSQNINSYAVAQRVEWAYAFDVHCNAFVPVFLILHCIQLLFLPILLKENSWICMLMGNFIYCLALVWYIVSTFLGFNALPFLVHTELMLYPIALCIVALFIITLFGFNISQSILHYYFK